jgi:hypothetical protein
MRPAGSETGGASAAILAAGIGLCAFGIGVCLSEAIKPVAAAFTLYKPTGPLSGKVALGVVVWLVAWFILARMWGGKAIGVRNPFVASLVLIAIGLLLTFPPVMELVIGG